MRFVAGHHQQAVVADKAGQVSDVRFVADQQGVQAMLLGADAQPDATVGRLARDYPEDPGVVASLLLNPVTLQPGESLFVPAGFAHGFITLEDETEVSYQMTEFYHPQSSKGFRWNDPAVGIAPDDVGEGAAAVDPELPGHASRA